MLGKLLKYEFKSTGRILLPLYAAIVVFSIFSRMFNSINSKYLSMPQDLMLMFCVILIVASFALTIFIIIQRFYKNLLGDEGYLMFTIPVTASQNILSKIITAFTWLVMTTVVSIVSILILVVEKVDFKAIGEAINMAHNYVISTFGNSVYTLIALCLVLIIIYAITAILMLYTAISIGQLFSNHKLIGSFLSYIGINFICQFAMSMLLVLSACVFKFDVTLSNPFTTINSVILFICGVITLEIIFGVAYFFTSRFILTKKLNLQ